MDFSDILLTVDYDRTLTGPDAVIPQRNLEAIDYFMAHGGNFTVNTGRSTTTFRQAMDKVRVNAPLLLLNGSAAYENGEYFNIHTIDLPMWEVLDRLAEEFPQMNLEVQGLHDHYLVNEKPEMVAFYEGVGWHHSPATRDTDMGPFVKIALFGEPRRSEVATMFESTPEDDADFDRLEARINELWGDKVVVFRAAPRIIDIHAKGCSKLNAARELQAQLKRKILVCVGDAENDITMLDGADHAFCPSDGVIAARYPNVCPCGEGAVADVIYKKIPEILGFQP